MSKTIAYCADGTWDSSSNNTNVYKIFKSMSVTADQIPLYGDGVGVSENPFSKILGGAFGTGLWRKIKDGYTKISHVYEAGDSLFLFGFSRGAYTARSLAGMIAVCGLPTKNFTDDLVEVAFAAYRERNPDERKAKLDKLKDCDMFPATIKMVGVWDTVGSLGIPSVFGLVDPLVYGFLDTGLHPSVLNAYHAMAIDEMRAEFPATLWKAPFAPGQTVEQVWFTGVHSDVGGGEPDDTPGVNALSDITLSWMMDKASALGLKFDKTIADMYRLPLDAKNALDKLHTSWSVVAGFPRRRSIDRNSRIANSVLIRAQHDTTYRPQNLVFESGLLANTYDIAPIVGEPPVESLTQTAGG
jgi:uncharacterized protein (DUF2235 family)